MNIETPTQTITEDTTPYILMPKKMDADDRAAQRQKNEAVRQLLREWLADESGYDEEVWPQVKQIIEDNRLSMRSRFGD